MFVSLLWLRIIIHERELSCGSTGSSALVMDESFMMRYEAPRATNRLGDMPLPT